MVKSYISALRAILKDDGKKLNEDLFLVSPLTRACHYVNDRSRTHLPLQKSLLSVLLKYTEIHFNKNNQPYLSLLYRTIFSTMYYGLLRISEVAAGDYALLAKNVHIGNNKKKLLLILHSSKTHSKANQPQLVKISSKTLHRGRTVTKNDCPYPYQLLRLYAHSHGPYHRDDNKFFVFSDGAAVHAKAIRNCFKQILKEAGYNPKLYGTHSLRAGHTCDLLKLGLSIETIKKLGQWKSNAVFHYMRYYIT